MSHNPNTVKSQDDLIKKAFENQNDDLIKNALNSGYIKSQDDLNPCNDGKRSSDVLVATLEKCERLQKQLDIAKEVLQEFCDDGYFSANKALFEIEELNTTNISDNITKAIKEIEDVSEWIKQTGRKF